MGDLDNFSENQTIMYKDLPLPEETDEQRENNMQPFRENLELILDNSELILNTPEYFFIRHTWALAGGAYVGAKYIPLGVLVMLWESGEWLSECQKCGHKTYIFCAGGSPLSGSHFYQAICTTCNVIVNREMESGLTMLMKPAFELCNKYSQKRKILRVEGQFFSWSKGVVESAASHEKLEDVIAPVDLKTLIKQLK
jgi:hypothetical protein